MKTRGPRVSIEPAGVTVFCRCNAEIMSRADTPSVASLAKENSTKICSGRSPRMLIFLTPGTCRRSWRITSACLTSSRIAMPFAFSEAHVGVLVVDKRAEDAGRQVASFIAQLLASLVELLLHGRRRCAVFERYRHVCVTGPRGRLDPVVPGQLLKPLLQRFGDEVLHLARRRARP